MIEEGFELELELELELERIWIQTRILHMRNPPTVRLSHKRDGS